MKESNIVLMRAYAESLTAGLTDTEPAADAKDGEAGP